MSRAKIVKDQDGRFFGVAIDCPGCAWPSGTRNPHTLETDWMPAGMERSHGARPDRWVFDGNLDQPTFSPSLLVQSNRWDGKVQQPTRCHSFIREGKIQFLQDCTHPLAGQTVDLPEIGS